MSLMKQLTNLAKSKQGKELLEKAKTIANDPRTREKLEDARGKFTEHVETAKHKMAEKKAKDGDGDGQQATYGDGSAQSATPQYGEQAPASDPAPTYGEGDPASATPTYGEPSEGGTPPTQPHEQPVGDSPAYGEQSSDAPTYGEDGPKAA